MSLILSYNYINAEVIKERFLIKDRKRFLPGNMFYSNCSIRSAILDRRLLDHNISIDSFPEPSELC
jgi:hypothetical protein